MRPSTILLSNFKRGEISPNSLLKIDDKYYTGLKKLTNFYVHPDGHLVKRPPFRVIDSGLITVPAQTLPDFEITSHDFSSDKIGYSDSNLYTATFDQGGTVNPYPISVPIGDTANSLSISQIQFIRGTNSGGTIYNTSIDVIPTGNAALGSYVLSYFLVFILRNGNQVRVPGIQSYSLIAFGRRQRTLKTGTASVYEELDINPSDELVKVLDQHFDDIVSFRMEEVLVDTRTSTTTCNIEGLIRRGSFKVLTLKGVDYYITECGISYDNNGTLEAVPIHIRNRIDVENRYNINGIPNIGYNESSDSNTQFEYFNSITGKKYNSGIFSLNPNNINVAINYNASKIIRGEILLPASEGVFKLLENDDGDKIITHFFVESFSKAGDIAICRVEDPQNVYPVDKNDVQELIKFKPKNNHKLQFILQSYGGGRLFAANRDYRGIDTEREGRLSNLILYFRHTISDSDRSWGSPRTTFLGLSDIIRPSSVFTSREEQTVEEYNNFVEGLKNRPVIATIISNGRYTSYGQKTAGYLTNRLLMVPLDGIKEYLEGLAPRSARDTVEKEDVWLHSLFCSYMFLDGVSDVSDDEDDTRQVFSFFYRTPPNSGRINFSGSTVVLTVLEPLSDIVDIDYIDQRYVFVKEDGTTYMSDIGKLTFSNNDAHTLGIADLSQLSANNLGAVSPTLTPANGFSFQPVFRAEVLELSGFTNYNNTLISSDFSGIYQFAPTNPNAAISFNNFSVRKLVDGRPESNIFNSDDLLFYIDKGTIVDAFYQRGYDRLVVDTKSKRSEHLFQGTTGKWQILPYVLKDDIYCAINKDTNRLITFTLFKPRELGGFSEIPLPDMKILDASFDYRNEQLNLLVIFSGQQLRLAVDPDANFSADFGLDLTAFANEEKIITLDPSLTYIDENGLSVKDPTTHSGRIYLPYESVVETLPIFPTSGKDGTFKVQTAKKLTDLVINAKNLTNYSVTIQSMGNRSNKVEKEIPTVSAADMTKDFVDDYGILIRDLFRAFPHGEDFTIKITDKSTKKSIVRALSIRSTG